MQSVDSGVYSLCQQKQDKLNKKKVLQSTNCKDQISMHPHERIWRICSSFLGARFKLSLSLQTVQWHKIWEKGKEIKHLLRLTYHLIGGTFRMSFSNDLECHDNCVFTPAKQSGFSSQYILYLFGTSAYTITSVFHHGRVHDKFYVSSI